jgi:hypothetical protein
MKNDQKDWALNKMPDVDWNAVSQHEASEFGIRVGDLRDIQQSKSLLTKVLLSCLSIVIGSIFLTITCRFFGFSWPAIVAFIIAGEAQACIYYAVLREVAKTKVKKQELNLNYMLVKLSYEKPSKRSLG